EIYQSLGDEIRISNCLNYIGGVYYTQGEYDHALDYFLSALGYREIVGDKSKIAAIMNNVAMIYKNMGNYEKSLEYYMQAMNNYNDIGNKKLYAATQNHIGNLYKVQNKLNNALSWFKKAYDIRRNINDKQGIAQTALDIGTIYKAKRNNAAALAFINKSIEIAKDLNDFQLLRDVYLALYEINKKMGRTSSALRFYENYTAWKDSVFNMNTLEKITQVQMQNEAERMRMKIAYENDQKQKEIEQLKSNREEQEKYYNLKVKAEQDARNFIIAVAVGLLLVIILLINRFVIKSRANKKLRKANDELSELNTRLNKSEKELKLLNVTKDKFFSIIAHDLRNPFTALVSLSEVLSNKVDTMTSERRKEVIDQITYAATNTYRLLGNLLEWSRSQQEGIKFVPEIIPLKPLTEEIVSLQLNLAQQKELNIAIEIEPNSDVETDRHMISFVIRNLLGNAIKFTPKGGNISISTQIGKSEVIYKVTDTGVGISRSNIEKLFDLNSHYT
ncbi:MAG: hypothetical protein C0599_06165, partial [Salinivirgaceae bacterium]